MDVGANLGASARYFLHRPQADKLAAYEPSSIESGTRSLLETNLRPSQQALLHNKAVLHSQLASRAGQVQLTADTLLQRDGYVELGFESHKLFLRSMDGQMVVVFSTDGELTGAKVQSQASFNTRKAGFKTLKSIMPTVHLCHGPTLRMQFGTNTWIFKLVASQRWHCLATGEIIHLSGEDAWCLQSHAGKKLHVSKQGDLPPSGISEPCTWAPSWPVLLQIQQPRPSTCPRCTSYMDFAPPCNSARHPRRVLVVQKADHGREFQIPPTPAVGHGPYAHL